MGEDFSGLILTDVSSTTQAERKVTSTTQPEMARVKAETYAQATAKSKGRPKPKGKAGPGQITNYYKSKGKTLCRGGFSISHILGFQNGCGGKLLPCY